MTRSWWVVFGALGGACLFGAAAVLVRVMAPDAIWSLYTPPLIPVVGLVAGGLLGSRALRGWPRPPVPSSVPSSAPRSLPRSAAVRSSSSGGPEAGLARFQGKNFVIGAIVGGVVGTRHRRRLVLGPPGRMRVHLTVSHRVPVRP